MVAEQVGPQGRTLMLRSAVDGQVFRTAHRSQTVYHGAVVYADDPYRRLENASSVLEFALLLLFMESAAHRAQREYRFAVWAQEEPGRDRVDLKVSPALLDAMQNSLRIREVGSSHGNRPPGKSRREFRRAAPLRRAAEVEAPLPLALQGASPPVAPADDLEAPARLGVRLAEDQQAAFGEGSGDAAQAGVLVRRGHQVQHVEEQHRIAPGERNLADVRLLDRGPPVKRPLRLGHHPGPGLDAT